MLTNVFVMKKNNKKTLIINVDILFQTVCIEIIAVRANSKFQFVRATVSKIHFHTATTK